MNVHFQHIPKQPIYFGRWVICSLILLWLFIVQIRPSSVLAQRSDWPEPIVISSEQGHPSRASLVADPYGNVHAVWAESGFEDERPVLQHALFRESGWTPPNDIFIGDFRSSIGPPAIAIDDTGDLHVTWTAGVSGPIYYFTAPAAEAYSAAAWSQPIVIDFPAFQTARPYVDSSGVIHLIYSSYFNEPRGVFYSASQDGGNTWSMPFHLDPDIPANYATQSIAMSVDGDGGLHVVWFYTDPSNEGVPGRWVRYAHSLDGGRSWSTPMTIDIDVDDSLSLRAAGPVMAAAGDTVMIVWAGGEQPYRNFRVSNDRGLTWSDARRIPEFGNLHGQASESLVADHLGRIHFIGQVRYPMAVHHAIWDGTRWSVPEIAYLIAAGNEVPPGRIHAHYVDGAFQAGNHLVITFTDPPSALEHGLYSTTRALSDLPVIPAAPLPVPEIPVLDPTPAPTEVMPTAASESKPTVVDFPNTSTAPVESPIQFGLLWAAVVVLVFLGLASLFKLRKTR